MKRFPYLAGIVMLLLSCSSGSNSGSLETEILSKKTFESLKTNDYNIYKTLLPDKDIFTKLAEIEIDTLSKNPTAKSAAFDKLNARSREAFEMVQTHAIEWDKAEFINSTEEAIKTGNVSVSSVTFKFSVGSEFYKVKYTAKKMSGRWYSMGDLFWIPK